MSNIRKIEVTPEIARKLLESNYEGQRKVRKSTVEKYASDMMCGRWNTDAGGVIIISSDGRLIDGQHRLEAVIKSGATIWFYVMEDADPSAFPLIDSGVKRSVGDVIGGRNAKVKAAITSAASNVIDNGVTIPAALCQSVVSKGQAVEFYERNQDNIDKAASLCVTIRHSVGRASSKAVGLAIFLMLDGYVDEIDYAVEDLCSTVPADSRVSAFKAMWMRGIVNGKMDARRQFAFIVKLVDAIANDKPLNKFSNTVETVDKMSRTFRKSGKLF